MASKTGEGAATGGRVRFEQCSMIVEGVFDNGTALKVRQEGERLLRECREKQVTVELSGLETTSSVVLSMLLCWMRSARRQGVDLELVNAPGKLYDMARVSGLDTFLPFAASSAVGES